MSILVVDGQGGGIGRALVEALKNKIPSCKIVACGTNSLATSAMLKAGADCAATGENAIIYNAKNADMILGPIGIVLANSLLGEITPKMAAACAEAEVPLVLVPVSKCRCHVAGLPDMPLAQYIASAAEKAERLLAGTLIK